MFTKLFLMVMILILFLNVKIYGEVIYGVSNKFALGQGDKTPFIKVEKKSITRGSGDLSISNVIVNNISSTKSSWGNSWTGVVKYDVSSSTSKVFIWTEFSNDGGTKWTIRDIHGIGDIGPNVNSGSNKKISWRIDGDKGTNCLIRIRANNKPAIYREETSLKMKYPDPIPLDPYENIERLVSEVDGFDFNSPQSALPDIDFKVSTAGEQAKVGFAKKNGVHDKRTEYFVWVMYISIGGKEFVISIHDIIILKTSFMEKYKQEIQDKLGIPKEHIMILITHTHGPANQDVSYPIDLIQKAKSKAVPAKMAYGKIDVGSLYNLHRNTILNTGNNKVVGTTFSMHATNCPIIWQYDESKKVIGALVDAKPQLEDLKKDLKKDYGLSVSITPDNAQLYFDGPRDSELHFLLFKDNSGTPIGSFLKFTGHLIYGEVGSLCQYMRKRFGGEAMVSIGFGGNHMPIEIPYNINPSPNPKHGAERFGDDLSQKIINVLPSLKFEQMTKVGVVNGWGSFGTGDASKVLIQCFGFNDVLIPVLGCEAPSEQGLYIRAKTNGLNVFYTGYGNSWLQYYTWGRWFDRNIYENWHAVENRYQTFRMAEESIRGVNILKDAMEKKLK
ncbi:MAG: hypothetical protein ABH873_01325 [Candidatus Firestonebacteria bacterium]